MNREELKIDDWLELVKEDKNLKGAYVSFAQYIYLLEKENQELKEKLEKCIPISEQVETIKRKNKRIEDLKQENEKLNHYKLLYQKVKERNVEAIEFIENNLSLGVSTFGSVYSIGANKVLDILRGNNEE